MGFRDQIEWAGRTALLVFVLASVAFLSALMTMRFVIQGREVSTPNLTGLSVVQAEQQAAGRGLHMKIEDRIYSNLPKDDVVRQSPSPDSPLKRNEWVHVVVSLGAQSVSIPELENRSSRAAQIELLSEGLQAGEISNVHLTGSAPDMVLQQDPAAGSTHATSPHVDMLVSLGPSPRAYVMPSLEGLPQAEAAAQIAAAGLKLSKVTTMPLTGKPSGTVTSQLPLRGARVEVGDSVELQVAQ